MSLVKGNAGSFSAVFLGDTGVGTVLTKLKPLRTGGCSVDEEVNREWVDSVGNQVQSGRHTIQTTLTFYDDGDMITKIARGIPLTGNATDPPGDAQYVLFLVNSNPLTPNSYLLPSCQTITRFVANYDKGNPTQVAITFTDQDRDRTANIEYKNTQAALKAILGGRSPI